MKTHHIPQKTIPAGREGAKRIAFLSLLLAFAALLPNGSRAANLEALNGQAFDLFGGSVSPSGNIGLVGALGNDDNGSSSGAAYVFFNLSTATDTVTEDAKLTASDGVAGDRFGGSVNLSGTIGLVAAYGDDGYQGSVYVFRGLDTINGPFTENAKLTASDGAESDVFGWSVSLSGSNGLVGAYGANAYQGAAYVFHGLDTATGAVTESAKLTASDGAGDRLFGVSVSLSGSTGLIGSSWDTVGSNDQQGSAYVFRGLDTATGAVVENAKLTASDGEVGDRFGNSVSLSGSIGLVGASLNKSYQGAAYVFRGLDTVMETAVEDAKLTASDGAEDDSFGYSVSLSGSNGLVGAYHDDDSQGSVYLFRDLDTASGAVTENVKITASDGASGDAFGVSVSLSGDNFLIGADQKNTQKGKAYSGSVSSMTTLDAGNVEKVIFGIDCVSRGDWIIGQTTDGNSVTLSVESTANVTATDKKVYIGKNAGSDNNTLIIDGSFTPTEVRVGAEGNSGNSLIVEFTGVITGGSNVYVASGSSIGGNGLLQGNLTLDAGAKLEFDSNDGLDVHGAITLDPTFGVDDILGLDGITTGTHILISTLVTNFSTLGLENFGSANHYSIGGGKLAYLSSPVQGTLLLTVISTPVITSFASTSGKVGTTLTYQITANNGPTSYSATSLPPGLTVSTTTGKITGKPTKAGTFSTTVKATNAAGTGTKVVKFIIAKETTVPVISVTSPSALKGDTITTSYTVKGTATDNISPVKVQYRIDPPTAAGYGAYKTILLSGTATSKTWSCKVPTLSKGIWKVQFRALDATGNISTVKTVTITRK